MSIKSRLPKINQIAKTASVVFDNSKHNGRIIYHVDSVRTGKPFQVTTEIYRNSILNATVSLYTFDHKEQINERGNHPADFNSKVICYQGLGALKARAKASGKVLSICKDYKAAKNLLNLGGEIIKISNLGKAVVWGTLR